VFCVLINHNWQRARLLQAKFSHAGTLKIFCIDYGDTHVVPLTFVRTLDIPGIEAEHVRNWPPLATKCRLADVVAAPVSQGSHSCWTDQTMMFMMVHALDRTWKAAIVDIHDDKMGMRLCNSENKLLATLMIEQDVGIPTCTYTEALNMMQGFTYSAGDTKLIEKVISLKTQNCSELINIFLFFFKRIFVMTINLCLISSLG
jgi:tudor domain-containing protein 1/4/6/7